MFLQFDLKLSTSLGEFFNGHDNMNNILKWISNIGIIKMSSQIVYLNRICIYDLCILAPNYRNPINQ